MMFKRIAALVIASALLAATVSARQATAVDTAALGTYIQSEFEKTHIPGMSVQIVDSDSVLFSKAYGNCPSVDAPMVLGSLSKSFTAAAIMQLAEQGKVDLDRPASDYLPETDPHCAATVRQLLNQTSGIKTYDTLEHYAATAGQADYEYANVNYGLLGRIVEQVSGLDYATYVETNLFAPLGMENSFTSLMEAKANGLSMGHRNYFGVMVAAEQPYPDGAIQGWLNLPSAHLISSAADMGRYLQSYLRGGEGILSPSSVDAMFWDNVPVQEDYRYGMGWGLDTRMDEPILTHGGNVETYTTNLQILPERGIGIVVQFNACDYFVANGAALQLSYNIAYRLMGLETDDLQAGAYWRSHTLIDLMLVAALLLCAVPLLRLRRWRKRRALPVSGMIVLATIVGHALLAAIPLALFSVVGIPMAVVRGFAPDVFLVQVLGSALLFAACLCKIVWYGRKPS